MSATSLSSTTSVFSASTSRSTPVTTHSPSSTFVTPSVAPTVSILPGVPADDTCGGGMLTLPDGRPACAIHNSQPRNNSYAFYRMYSCCRGQPIVAYGASERNPQPCYMYCLAQEQTVGDLIDCLNDPFQEVLCNGDKSSTGNETTFGTPSPPASGSGSVSASLSASGSTGAAAPGTAVHPGASKWGVGILVMLGIGSAVGMLL